MQFQVTKPVTIDVAYVRISIPLRYDDDGGMAKDFPLRNGQIWTADVDIETGEIHGFPATGAFEVYEKASDSGCYYLLDSTKQVIASRENEYVPDIVPGEWGDYVILKIRDGKITNWPRNPEIESFFGD